MIKAIANESDRHIINVNLSNVKTKTQLHSLFYDEEIRVAPDASTGPGNDDVYTIPIHRRLYVLEVSAAPAPPHEKLHACNDMKYMNTFQVITEVGAGRESATARPVKYTFDDVPYAALIPFKMRKYYFDRWGAIRLRAGHFPLLRLIVLDDPSARVSLHCLNGDRFDYRRENWEARPLPDGVRFGAGYRLHRERCCLGQGDQAA